MPFASAHLSFTSNTGARTGRRWKIGWLPKPSYSRGPCQPKQANQHVPFHGYYFQELLKQGADAKGGAKDYVVNGKMTGGFAYVAYPAEYGVSGVMTFLINQGRVVYQKDRGKTTADAAAAMTEFKPDKSWTALGQ